MKTICSTIYACRHAHINKKCYKRVSVTKPNRLYLSHTQPNRRVFLHNKRFFGAVNFTLADIGEGIHEVEVVKWFVKEGDSINEFDAVCEVQSDKANVEISSRYNGVIKSLSYKEGEIARVGKPLMVIETSDEGESSAAEAAAPTTEAPKSASTSPKVSKPAEGGKALLSPAVRRICKEHNIDPNLVPGTGPSGRVLKGDVLAYMEKSGIEMPPPADKKPAAPAPVITHIEPPKPDSEIHPSSTSAPAQMIHSQEDRSVAIKGVQRIMVSKMVESNAVPQFGYGDEVNMNNLVALRESLKPSFKELGVKVTYLAFILKAASIALKDYPILNATVDDAACTSMTYRAAHNIGIAVDSPNGLIVPNVKDVNLKSVVEIAKSMDDLASRARSGKITNSDITGGTFTISNIGAIGGTYCRPIVFVPEVCIGALGGMQTLPRFDSKGAVEAQKTMAVSWSADHRVIDGATVARFSNRWKQLLENPGMMLVDLK